MKTNLILTLLLAFFVTACYNTRKHGTLQSEPNVKTADQTTGEGNVIFTAPVVKKQFVKKNNQPTDFYEYYLQRSIQDYFIKFCESKITRKDLEAYLEKQDDLIQTITVEAEIREGLWDRCPGDEHEVQSRMGNYVVIYRIIE